MRPDVAKGNGHLPGGVPRDPVRVQLLDGFRLLDGGVPVDVAPGVQRLVAFLALRERPVGRPQVAAELWPDASEDDALARLRSALWRLRRRCDGVVEGDAGTVGLTATVAIDLQELLVRVHRLLDRPADLPADEADPQELCRELLPDWWDEWVVAERERLRQLRLHALESLAGRLTTQKRFAAALDVALSAVALEPLRESPHRCVVGIHLAEGNRSEALRSYESYRGLLRDELDVEPSPRMEELVAGLRGPVARRRIPVR